MSITYLLRSVLVVACLTAVAGCSGWEPMEYPKPASETPEGEGLIKPAFERYIDSRIEKSKQ